MSSAAQRRGVLANGGRGRGRSGLTRGSTYPSDRAGTAIFCASRGSERSVPGRRVLRLRAMSLLCAAVLAGAALLLGGPGPGAPSVLPGQSDCCRDALEMNGTCLINAHCDPGCCLLTMENSTYVCVPWTMVNRTQYNLTECSSDDPNATVWLTNTSTVAPVRPKIGGPGVAASLLLGTLFISLFLILTVAASFYLKRTNKLPSIFYRRNKASILQPSETADMIPTPTSSVRRPRYVRRERPTVTAATISTAAVTRVSNV
ncbi:uncharacterized protein C1orf159 homolog isoform X1 [Lepisosteus oculatus]|uniref:uncharacterized protein C1orf159 homolog isoform X1 n=2 Tax=Lepisosteus oculatus TaxID=7918 RepID=UPI00371AE3BC